MYQSVASTVLMIKPKHFGYNPETAEDNQFMAKADQFATIIHQTASKEHENLAKLLRSNKINVIIEEEADGTKKPDAIFPNWLSFHNSGKVVLYPFKAPSRRLERRMDIIERMKEVYGFDYKQLIDYTSFEEQGKYLEGMGSLVLDRINRIAYSCLSQRTNKELVELFCKDFEFKPVTFRAEHQVNGTAHTFFYTNIIMSIGEKFVLVSSELIPDTTERENVLSNLKASGKDIIEVSPDQTRNFLANAINLKNSDGKNFLVMSRKAHGTLTPEQEKQLSNHAEILVSDVHTIENYGGGSIGNLVTPVFLPKN